LCDVTFWKGPRQEEVDFVVTKGGNVAQLIQVCWNMRSTGTRNREVRSLLKASEALSCRRLLIVTAEDESEESAEWYGANGRIQILPFHKWLSDLDLEADAPESELR
jgi:predicted AAA+ superfamily ATPase